MKRIYRVAAAVLLALAGFAALGAGVLLVATAAAIGVLVTLAARLAIRSQPSSEYDWTITRSGEDHAGI